MYPVELTEALPGPDWLKASRSEAARRAERLSLPTFEAEEWRYSPIADFAPGNFVPAAEAPTAPVNPSVWINDAAACIITSDGFLVERTVGDEAIAANVTVSSRRDLADAGPFPEAHDVFGEANAALAPDPILIDVPRGKDLEGPIVVIHHAATDGVAVFPRVDVRVGDDASVTVVEILQSADVAGLIVPITNITVGPAARVRYLQVQVLGSSMWEIASLGIDVQSQANFVGGVAAMGAGYGRLRTHCRLTGRGASGDLLAAYFGSGKQTLDFRTFQDHLARDTTSNLLFKGVLDDWSKSIYTGLIKVAPTAAGTNAFQTNRNIKLSEHAWAESVPNLQIENNDVRCSHASTVSPVDPEQRFYLESRGVPTEAAERLIVEGFLQDVISKLDAGGLAEHLSTIVAAKLDRRSVRV